jgi:hypothetical protein
MRTPRVPTVLRLLAAASAVLAVLALAFPPGSAAFSLLGFSLGVEQRDVRIFNNFLDATANDNTTPDPQFPGALGATMAVWKGVVEWGSELHGTGGGDPSQPGDLGSGGANFDVTWQGEADGPGPVNGNVISATTLDVGAQTAVFDLGPTGWRIRFADSQTFDDGPGVNVTGVDIQGVTAHMYGHALGLGHSTTAGATMFPIAVGSAVSARSIEADDSFGLQVLYGVRSPAKPRVTGVTIDGGLVEVEGERFAAFGNEVWFTRTSPSTDGEPVVVSGLVSSAGGTRIDLALPADAGPGDLLVRVPGGGGASLSNAYPYDVPGSGPPSASREWTVPIDSRRSPSPRRRPVLSATPNVVVFD